MLNYPNINPVLLHLTDTFQVRWYGLMYVIGFFMAWVLLRYRTKNLPGWQNYDTINDLFLYCIMGVLLGGRIGYMLFYDLLGWINHPLSVFAMQSGGMSFHGGFVGVTLAILYFCHQYKMRFLTLTDWMVQVVPLGLATGRIGNFINGELWGRATELPWAMIFPHVDELPRHPSQLYAVALEGVLLFLILFIYSRFPRRTGQMTGLFLLAYGFIRIFEELFRQPDLQYGYLAFGWLTMGQLLCCPMLIIGFILFCKKEKPLCIST